MSTTVYTTVPLSKESFLPSSSFPLFSFLFLIFRKGKHCILLRFSINAVCQCCVFYHQLLINFKHLVLILYIIYVEHTMQSPVVHSWFSFMPFHTVEFISKVHLPPACCHSGDYCSSLFNHIVLLLAYACLCIMPVLFTQACIRNDYYIRKIAIDKIV